LKKYKEELSAGNGRGTALKSPRRAARKAAHRPDRASHAR